MTSASNFPEELKKALNRYTDEDFYSNFNRRLRNDQELTEEQSSVYKNLSIAFDISPPIEESITVYRGINKNNPSELKFFEKGFVSTTKSSEIALTTFGGDDCCLMVITVVAGSKAIDLSSISLYSEQEILINEELGDFSLIGQEYSKNNDITQVYMSYVPKQAIKITEKESESFFKLVDEPRFDMFDDTMKNVKNYFSDK